MRIIKLFVMAGLIAAAGCATPQQADIQAWRQTSEAKAVERPFQLQTREAILRQHTIFPHYFIPGSARLSPLGKRDLAILASQLKEEGPQRLIICPGDASHKLYLARLLTIRQSLGQAGVNAERVALVNGLPAGDGLLSEQAFKAFNPEQDKGGGNGSFIPMSPISNSSNGK